MDQKYWGIPQKYWDIPLKDLNKSESGVKIGEMDKKQEIPLQLRFEGFPIIFEKTG